MFSTIKYLCKAKIFTFKGIIILWYSLCRYGINLSVIIKIGKHLYPSTTALLFEDEKISYLQLYQKVEHLAYCFSEKYPCKKNLKVAIAMRNHSLFIYTLFAISRLGWNIYLLSPETKETQFLKLHQHHDFDLLISDNDCTICIDDYNNQILATTIQAWLEIPITNHIHHKRTGNHKLVVVTSGTTGMPKIASRNMKIHQYIRQLMFYLQQLRLVEYRSIYIATPIYHGHGVTALFVSLALGTTVYVTKKFDTHNACKLIQQYHIEVVTLVPLMLRRMLDYDVSSLHSLQCIISGSSPLSTTLVKRTQQILGDKLYNLYGTSEGGVALLATPQDLLYNMTTIGKPLPNVQIDIVDNEDKQLPIGSIGEIVIHSPYSVKKDSWIKTGDIGYRDTQGYFFLKGRKDDMIVSGGENVYPIELENILIQHPHIKEVAVIGVDDEDFGQRLMAFVVVEKNKILTDKVIRLWLISHIARYQMPKKIHILENLPYNHTGKIDKKQLVMQ